MKGCRPLTDEEIRDVAAAFSGPNGLRDRALFLLGVRSGFRISEVLSLRLGDVLQHGRIVERVAVRRCSMKRKIEGRSVVLHPEAKAALDAWLKALQQEGLEAAETFVFRSRRGRNAPIGRIQAWRLLNAHFHRLGLSGKLGTHSMRKSFANRLYDRLGHDLVRTQRALGHRNINSTVSYLSFREEDIDAAVLAA